MKMDGNSESAWRKALEAKGRDWVASELQRRPGRPDDVVLDIVFMEPYPTREFCQKWCSDQENRMFRLSGHTIAIIVASLLLMAFGIKLINSWDSNPALQKQTPGSAPVPLRAAGPPS